MSKTPWMSKRKGEAYHNHSADFHQNPVFNER